VRPQDKAFVTASQPIGQRAGLTAIARETPFGSVTQSLPTFNSARFTHRAKHASVTVHFVPMYPLEEVCHIAVPGTLFASPTPNGVGKARGDVNQNKTKKRYAEVFHFSPSFSFCLETKPTIIIAYFLFSCQIKKETREASLCSFDNW